MSQNPINQENVSFLRTLTDFPTEDGSRIGSFLKRSLNLLTFK